VDEELIDGVGLVVKSKRWVDMNWLYENSL
jgi:hypothetical protein